jgi:type IV secretory pathway TraG/TraD family ATPase VirD4
MGKKKNNSDIDVKFLAEELLPNDSPPALKKELTEKANLRKGIVPDCMKLKPGVDGGFHFGKMLGDPHYIGKQQDRDGHILIVGGPGSHKTSAFVIPSLETWKGHIVVIDVKPQSVLRKKCEQSGKRVMVFNPLDDSCCSYDPYEFIRTDGADNLARNALDLAISLIPLPPDSRDTVWIKMAQNLLAGIIANDIAQHGEGDKHISFVETITFVANSSVEEIVEEVNRGSNATATMFISKFNGLKTETISGVGMDFAGLSIYAADSRLEKALGCKEEGNEIKWSDLNNLTEPLNIVLQFPEEKLSVWEPMIKLMIEQLIKTLEQRADKYTSSGESLPPVLIMLDEFASLGKIPSLTSGLSTLRSRGVTFCIIVQSLSQLDEIYGPAARGKIFDCCSYKALLNISDPFSQKYCSESIGVISVMKRSANTTYKELYGPTSSYSMQINETIEPIIFPHEFATLKDVVLLHPEGFCRIDKKPYFVDISATSSNTSFDNEIDTFFDDFIIPITDSNKDRVQFFFD